MNAPQTRARFLCLSCGQARLVADAALDSDGFLICDACWALNPPQVDVDGIFAEIAAGVEADRAREIEDV